VAAESGGKQKLAYDEIQEDQLMKLQPVTPRHSGHENDPGWCKFKFQTLPSNRGDSGHRSSSSSNPTLGSTCGEMYSNLGDLFVGGAFVGEAQRRHSFTEGDELIVIRGTTNRDSIIPAGGRADDVSYNSVGAESRECLLTVAGQEEALYTNTDKVIVALDLEVKHNKGEYYNLALADVGEGAGLACKKTVVPKPKLRSVIPPKPEGVIPSRMSGELMESEDYMNEVPEGVFHTYSNHKELLEQLQAGNSPVPEPVTESVALLGGEKKISVMFKSLISRTPFVKKTPNEIHSQSISETDRQKTLQPFALSGNAQAGRDYEAFFKASAWGASENRPIAEAAPESSTGRIERPRRHDIPGLKPSEKPESGLEAEEKRRQQPQLVFPAPDPSQETKSETLIVCTDIVSALGT
jgi:hypothetical protein